jgi:hypothetical protein
MCALAVLLLASTAGAQVFRAPGTALDEPRRAPITLLPTLTVTQEYNDNILLDNTDRRSDFITGFTPALALILERPTYRVAADYHFTAEIYARDERRNHAFDRQNFSLDSVWRVDPRLTLSLRDAFSITTDTNLLAAEGVATGRDRALSNTLAPGVTWVYDRLTTVRVRGSHTLQRFQRAELFDSDVFRLEGAVDRTLTPRLHGTLAYELAYFDVSGFPTTTAHTPQLGFTYRITPTLTGSISGGPTVVVDGGTRVTPAASLALDQRFAWGSVRGQYDRALGTAGGLGAVTDNQAIGVLLQVTTLLRGLTVEAASRYRTVQSDDDSIDVRAFTLALRGSYRLTAWLAAVASYTFFHQDAETTILTPAGRPIARDVDQNRIFVGLQAGFPVRFD